MKTDYEKLKKITDEIDVLIAKQVDYSDIDFKAWKIYAEGFLIHKYGKYSFERKSFMSIYAYSSDFTPSYMCMDDLKKTKAIFFEILE